MRTNIMLCWTLLSAACLSLSTGSPIRAAEPAKAGSNRLATFGNSLDRCQTLAEIKRVAREFQDVLLDPATVRYLDARHGTGGPQATAATVNRLMRRFCQDTEAQGPDHAAELFCVRMLMAALTQRPPERRDVVRLLEVAKGVDAAATEELVREAASGLPAKLGADEAKALVRLFRDWRESGIQTAAANFATDPVPATIAGANQRQAPTAGGSETESRAALLVGRWNGEGIIGSGSGLALRAVMVIASDGTYAWSQESAGGGAGWSYRNSGQRETGRWALDGRRLTLVSDAGRRKISEVSVTATDLMTKGFGVQFWRRAQ